MLIDWVYQVWEIIKAVCSSVATDIWMAWAPIISSAVTAVTAVATVILASGVFVAISQLKQTRSTTNLQLILSIFNDLRSDKARKTLDSIYILNREKAKKRGITAAQVRVLERIEMLGGLVNEGVVEPDTITRIYGGTLALKCWYKLCYYIKTERNNRGMIYCENLEDLASRTIEYWKRRRPEQKWIRLYGED